MYKRTLLKQGLNFTIDIQKRMVDFYELEIEYRVKLP